MVGWSLGPGRPSGEEIASHIVYYPLHIRFGVRYCVHAVISMTRRPRIPLTEKGLVKELRLESG